MVASFHLLHCWAGIIIKMASYLHPYQTQQLKTLEPKLRKAVSFGKIDEATKIVSRIEQLFPDDSDRNHYKILQAHILYYQALLDDNQIKMAGIGFEKIRKRASKRTKMYLEATALLGICHLRNNNVPAAKTFIRESILSINNIKSDSTRNQLQKRILKHVELESILGQLKIEKGSFLDATELNLKALEMLKSKSDEEIYNLIAENTPEGAVQIALDIKKLLR
jgi:hypothetical protein